MRIFLGSLAGVAIRWFLKPEDVTAFDAISPFALAFAAGYSIDLLFTLLDKIVNALLRAARCCARQDHVNVRRSALAKRY
jgi:hypothetical protein